jgi:hypothetical protein
VVLYDLEKRQWIDKGGTIHDAFREAKADAIEKAATILRKKLANMPIGLDWDLAFRAILSDLSPSLTSNPRPLIRASGCLIALRVSAVMTDGSAALPARQSVQQLPQPNQLRFQIV